MSARTVAASANRKLTHDPKRKPVAATYAPLSTCPTSCPFAGNGCYAEGGHVGRLTRKLARERAPQGPLREARDEGKALEALPTDGRPLRLHVSGDCRTDAAARALSASVARWQSAGGGDAWSYTHAWRRVPRDAWGGVSVLASCETAAEVEAATARGYATARVVAEFEGERTDSRGIACPAQTVGTSCVDCGLCLRADRLRRPILFAAHGPTRLVRAALEEKNR